MSQNKGAKIVAALNSFIQNEPRGPDVHVIQINRDIHTHGLYARRIWQKLFRLVDASKFEDLDSFLCDLGIFERLMDNRHFLFYWVWNDSGYTDTTIYDPGITCYKIHVFNDHISLTLEQRED